MSASTVPHSPRTKWADSGEPETHGPLRGGWAGSVHTGLCKARNQKVASRDTAGAPFCRHHCFLAPGFLLTSCCVLQSTTPSSRGSLAAPQHPPRSCAPPAHTESKQAQENTTHVKAVDTGTSADPERGAQTPARLAGSASPVMSDMCSVVCEPAALAARLAGALLSGRILNQAEPPAPGTRGDRPPAHPPVGT